MLGFNHWSELRKQRTCFAIATAVNMKSPVTMKILIPAALITWTASFTSARGGSRMLIKPTRVRSWISLYKISSSSFSLSDNLIPSRDRLQTAMTRWPSELHWAWALKSLSLCAASKGTETPSAWRIDETEGKRTSGAPLISIHGSETGSIRSISVAALLSPSAFRSWTTDIIHLLRELNGISNIFLNVVVKIGKTSLEMFMAKHFCRDSSANRRTAVSVGSPFTERCAGGSLAPVDWNFAPLQRREIRASWGRGAELDRDKDDDSRMNACSVASSRSRDISRSMTASLWTLWKRGWR